MTKTDTDKLVEMARSAGFCSMVSGDKIYAVDSDGKAKPKSTAFSVCSEDEMREFNRDAVDFLHTERAQSFIFRHVKAKDRQAMLDVVLADNRETATPPRDLGGNLKGASL